MAAAATTVRYRPMTKHPCSHPGCSASFIARSITERHEQEVHYICTCDRAFTWRGLRAHQGQFRRRGISHPPIPVVPLERDFPRRDDAASYVPKENPMPKATEAPKTERRRLNVKQNRPSVTSYNVDEIEEKGLPLDPVTPLNRLIWRLDIKVEAKERKKDWYVRRLPRRAILALGERGILQIQHLEGIRASELKMLPGVGEVYMRNIAQAAKLAGVNIIVDIDADGENVSVALSGNLVNAARHFVGAYLQVSPADLLRSAIMDHEQAIIESMYRRTQDIRNGELDRIHAQIEALQAQAAQIQQTRIENLLKNPAFKPGFNEVATK